MSKKLMCCGVYGKKELCDREFFYALRKDVDDDGNDVVVVHAVDRNGCPIKKGNLIVLPCNSEDEVLFCDDINKDLGLNIEDGSGVLMHDTSCCSDNKYLG